MTSRRQFRRSALFAAALALCAAFAASPARADRCDDIAKELADQIDKLKVNFKAANIVYLTHPRPRSCRSAAAATIIPSSFTPRATASRSRNSSPWSARAAAIVFTVPKDDTTTGSSRCLKRMGLLRGDKVVMRFRRLNMECTRTKTEAAIAITRGKDE